MNPISRNLRVMMDKMKDEPASDEINSLLEQLADKLDGKQAKGGRDA